MSDSSDPTYRPATETREVAPRARIAPMLRRRERWLARLAGCVCDHGTVRRALRLAARLYPDAEMEARHRLRFMLRTLWYRRTSAAWFRFLDEEPHRRQWVRAHPLLAEKLHRPYRRSDLGSGQRFAELVAHYLVVEKLGWETLASSICRHPVTVAVLTGKDSVELQVVLDVATQFAKEGEVCLHLQRGGVRLYSASCSLALRRDSPFASPYIALDVGAIQGQSGGSAAETVRRLTKALHGLRPRDLIIVALRAVADAAGADRIIGVSSRRHIYRHWRKRKKIAFDYDAIWREQQGQKRADGDFDVARKQMVRTIQEVPSHKRSEARRRNDLVADMQTQVVHAMAVANHGAEFIESLD